MAGVCKNAYGNRAFNDESTCRSVKCNACMMIGDGFQDGMAEQFELEKVGRRHLPAPPVRNRSKRAHKIKMKSSATVVKTYSKDDNGCFHDDPHQWNEERDTCYWEEKFRKKYYVKNKKMGFGLEYNCITCKKDVREGLI